MYPLSYILFHMIFIVLSGIVLFNYFKLYTGSYIIFSWLWFNLFIAIYEFYIVYNRNKFESLECEKDFWSQSIKIEDNFWLRAWHEYTCYSDTRYLEPTNPVFMIEATNAVIVMFLWIALITRSRYALFALLVIQILCCLLYFITLYISRKTNVRYPKKAFVYLAISSLWVFAPLVVLYNI